MGFLDKKDLVFLVLLVCLIFIAIGVWVESKRDSEQELIEQVKYHGGVSIE